jgi:hypothetical protein
MDNNERLQRHFEEDRLKFYNDFKSDLNNFMFKYVPGKLSIDEFEELCIKIYIETEKEWQKFI